MRVSIKDADWEPMVINVNGVEYAGLFTESRINVDDIPDSMHPYYMRHSDEDWGEMSTIEQNEMYINYGGTFLTKDIVAIPDSQNYANLTDYNYEDFDRTGLLKN